MAGPLQLAARGQGPNEGGVRLLHQPFALIGRDPRADVPLEHGLVSRRHVYLQIIEGEGFWIDLDSRSGTFSDGQLRKFGWLEPGKVIRVGPFARCPATARGCPGVPQWALACGFMADEPYDVVDRVGKRL